jgi:hypothetical protein
MRKIITLFFVIACGLCVVFGIFEILTGNISIIGVITTILCSIGFALNLTNLFEGV